MVNFFSFIELVSDSQDSPYGNVRLFSTTVPDAAISKCRLTENVTILDTISDKTRHDPLQDPAGTRADLSEALQTLTYFCRAVETEILHLSGIAV